MMRSAAEISKEIEGRRLALWSNSTPLKSFGVLLGCLVGWLMLGLNFGFKWRRLRVREEVTCVHVYGSGRK